MKATIKPAMFLAVVLISFTRVFAAGESVHIKKRGSVVAHKAKIYSLAFSPDGRLLASASEDRAMKLWNVADGTLKIAAEPRRGLTSVAFSPDGKLLFIGRGSGRTKLDIVNIASGKIVRSIEAGHMINNVALSPDGRRAATGAFLDKYLKVWDVATGGTVKDLVSPTRPGPGTDRTRAPRPMGYTTFSADGKYLVGCAASSTYAAIPTIWDATTLEVKCRFIAHGNRCYSIKFSPDSTILAIGTDGGTLKLWDVAAVIKAWSRRGTGKTKPDEIAQLIKQLDAESFKVREAALVKLIEIGGGAVEQLKQAQKSTVSAEVRQRIKSILKKVSDVDVEPLETLKPKAVLSKAQTGGVRALAFSSNSRLLAAGSWKLGTKTGQLTVWDVTRPDKPVLNLDTMGIEAIAFSPDGKTLLTGMQDGTITLWDVEAKK